MVNPTALRNDFREAVREVGEVVRFRYFGISGADASYDDDVVLTQSGTDLYVSGVVQPIDRGSRGSNEATLMEQGLLKNNDLRLYMEGGVATTSGTFRIGRGGSPSPGTNEYANAVEDGTIAFDVGQVKIYDKMYLRRLSTGSLMGE